METKREIEPLPRLQISYTDAAKACDIPQSTFEFECREGRGPKFFKVGRRKYATVEEVRKWQAAKFAELYPQ